MFVVSAPTINWRAQALIEAARTGKPVQFRGEPVGRMAPDRLTAYPDGSVVNEDTGSVVQQPNRPSVPPVNPGTPGAAAPPWEARRFRLDLDARTAGHAAFAVALLGFGYAGLRIGEATGRHFQWLLVGVSVGSLAGDILRDKVTAERRAEQRAGRAVNAQARANAMSDAMNPFWGGRMGGGIPESFAIPGYNPGSYGGMSDGAREAPTVDQPTIIRSSTK